MTGKGSVNHNSRKFHAKNTDPERSYLNVEYYIVNVHLCFETFLKDVCRQINKYGKNEYKPRIQEESYLSCAVRNICGNNLSDDMKPLYELCEYYRLIRNTSVHDLCEVDSHVK